MADTQAILTGVGGLLAAVGAVVAGIYTGRNARRKDDNEARIGLENARIASARAEEEASRQRVEDLARDAATSRAQLRSVEALHDIEMRDLRYERQRWEDLARRYFGLVGMLDNLLNNIIFASDSGDPERLVTQVRSAASRKNAANIPLSFDDPLPDRRKQISTDTPKT